MSRARWAAIGAAIAVSVGAGAGWVANAVGDAGVPSVFVPITPCRLLDTRPAPDNVGARNTPLGSGETFTTQVTGTNGNCTIPAGVNGVGLNVSIVNPSAQSFLTFFPADAPTRPLTSNLNWVAGQAPTPNAVSVRLSADGRLSIYNLSGTVDVLVDVNGYYTSSDERYYTKSQVDTALAGKVNVGQPIVLGESAGNWRTLASGTYSSFDIIGPDALMGATGIPPGSGSNNSAAYSLPLTQPALVGGTNYKLASVEYCLRFISGGVKVDAAQIYSDNYTSSLPLTQEVDDPTDRTAIGCYTVSTTNGTARSYALLLRIFQVSGTTGGVIITGVRSTWVPA